MKTRLALLVAVATVAALSIVGAAQAHVTVHPNALPAGGFTVINIQVPNERGKASTVRIDVQLPNGIYIASPMVMPGWRSRVITKKLSKPVEIEQGFSVSSRVDRVVYSGGRMGPAREVQSGSGYWSQNGAVQVFGLSSQPEAVWVRWPGGAETREPVPPAAREVVVSQLAR